MASTARSRWWWAVGRGRQVAALVYIDNETEHGKPKPGYLERVIRGTRHHGLPQSAMKGIAASSGGD